ALTFRSISTVTRSANYSRHTACTHSFVGAPVATTQNGCPAGSAQTRKIAPARSGGCGSCPPRPRWPARAPPAGFPPRCRRAPAAAPPRPATWAAGTAQPAGTPAAPHHRGRPTPPTGRRRRPRRSPNRATGRRTPPTPGDPGSRKRSRTTRAPRALLRAKGPLQHRQRKSTPAAARTPDAEPVRSNRSPRWRTRPPRERSEQRLADRVDHQAGQRTDHGAVDADELQVPPHLQLDLAGGLLGVPPLDRVSDQGGQLGAVVGDHVHHS